MIHIQNTAPGPPTTMAVATPAMLPVPTQPARAEETACRGVRVPSSPMAPPSFLNIWPAVFFIMWPNLRNWKKRVRTPNRMPTAASRIRTGAPQRALEIAFRIFSTFLSAYFVLYAGGNGCPRSQRVSWRRMLSKPRQAFVSCSISMYSSRTWARDSREGP